MPMHLCHGVKPCSQVTAASTTGTTHNLEANPYTAGEGFGSQRSNCSRSHCSPLSLPLRGILKVKQKPGLAPPHSGPESHQLSGSLRSLTPGLPRIPTRKPHLTSSLPRQLISGTVQPFIPASFSVPLSANPFFSRKESVPNHVLGVATPFGSKKIELQLASLSMRTDVTWESGSQSSPSAS